MARPASGRAHIEAARQLLRQAKTAQELRQAQAVLLPLELGLSLEQTAAAIARSRGATCTMRTRFFAIRQGQQTAPRSKRELRNRAHTSLQEEKRILEEVLAGAKEGKVLTVPQYKPLIEQRLGKSIALSTAYRMLARHGWRKIAPDTMHPQGDVQTREAWKKNLPKD